MYVSHYETYVHLMGDIYFDFEIWDKFFFRRFLSQLQRSFLLISWCLSLTVNNVFTLSPFDVECVLNDILVLRYMVFIINCSLFWNSCHVKITLFELYGKLPNWHCAISLWSNVLDKKKCCNCKQLIATEWGSILIDVWSREWYFCKKRIHHFMTITVHILYVWSTISHPCVVK